MKAIRDVRVPVLGLTVIAIGLLGYLVTQPWYKNELPGAGNLSGGAGQSSVAQIDPDFIAGIAQLQAGNAEAALASFKSFSVRAPQVPEAQVNLGFTYLKLVRLEQAEAAFQRALQIRPMQANAYYGLGLVYEHHNDLELARGAMRSFIHLSDDSNPYVRLAKSALWEWEQHPMGQEPLKAE